MKFIWIKLIARTEFIMNQMIWVTNWIRQCHQINLKTLIGNLYHYPIKIKQQPMHFIMIFY